MPVPLLHQTDLFRPHEDPDDHWDLACVYALAQGGALDLRGVLIDHPPEGHAGAPDVMGIAQMNHIAGLSVPCAVGAARPVERRGETAHARVDTEGNGVRFILRALEDTPEPLAITMVGSCRDVALAGATAPDLFRRKCRAVYLNAGSGTRRPETLGELEYNVRLNAVAFAGVFDLPCPVYWMPCFEHTPPRWEVEEFGTFYRFTQGEILEHLSPRMQAWFACMLERSSDTDWLGALRRAPDEATQARHAAMPRNMWCTAGFLHATGSTVTSRGDIVPLSDEARAGEAVFRFEPIEAACADDGVVRWRLRGGEGAVAGVGPNDGIATAARFVFRVCDRSRYAAAMTRAMRTLLERLDRVDAAAFPVRRVPWRG